MASSAMLHVRLDEQMKAEGLAALEAMGLTASDAVRLLFYHIVTDQAFPLELKLPNRATRDAMSEANEIIAAGARFEGGDALLASLNG